MTFLSSAVATVKHWITQKPGSWIWTTETGERIFCSTPNSNDSGFRSVSYSVSIDVPFLGKTATV
jgi:hypothetical protein